MLATANITDLRFRAKSIVKKSKKEPVWILRKGKIESMIIGADRGFRLIELEKTVNQPRELKGAVGPSFWDEVKKIQFKGPKNLSSKIDDIVYG